MHPVAFVTIVGPRAAFIICLKAIAGPHPAHARCPDVKSSGFSTISFAVNFQGDVATLSPPILALLQIAHVLSLAGS
jgi:hypothetical protein